jgi:signal transduction histidine kinase
VQFPVLPARVRTTALYAVLFTAVEAALVIGVTFLRLDAEKRSFDDRLLGVAYETSERLVEEPAWEPVVVERALATKDVLYAEVDDALGRTVVQSSVAIYPVIPALRTDTVPERVRFSDLTLPPAAKRFGARSVVRHVALPFLDAQGAVHVLHVVARTTGDAQVVDDLVDRLRWLVPLSLVAAAAVAWMLERRALRPLQDVAAAAASVSPDTLGTRIAVPEAHGEIAHLQETLNEALARIEGAFASQSRFVANVSHELRTPISVLLTEAQILDPASMSREEMVAFRASVETEMRRLGRTVDSLLALARSEHEGRLSHAEVVALLEVAMEAIQHSAPMARQHDVRIVPRFDLADETAPPRVLGDPDLLRTLLDNLLVNAIRHSPVGERVTFLLEAGPTEARISVLDRGRGLPPGAEERVFDRFVQGDGALPRGATGIGLHIAATVARLHGGTIAARNREEGGCAFVVVLPLCAAPVATS